MPTPGYFLSAEDMRELQFLARRLAHLTAVAFAQTLSSDPLPLNTNKRPVTASAPRSHPAPRLPLK